MISRSTDTIWYWKRKIAKEFHPGISAVISVNNEIVGVIGKVHPSICEDDVYVLEINIDNTNPNAIKQ